MESPTPAPQAITFSRPHTREQHDRLDAGIEEAVASFAALAEWYVNASLRMLRKQDESPLWRDDSVSRAHD